MKQSDDNQMSEKFDRWQRERFSGRYYSIGWHPVDDQKRYYSSFLLETRHEAEALIEQMKARAIGRASTTVYFVEAITKTETCSQCLGTGKSKMSYELDEDPGPCGNCLGVGKVRKVTDEHDV